MKERGDVEETKARIARMSKGAKAFGIVFWVGFWVLLVAALVVVVLGIRSGLSDGCSPAEIATGLITPVASIGLGCFVLWVVAKGFNEVSRERSPFSTVQAQRLKLLGVLLLVYAAIEMLLSISPFHAELGTVSLSYIQSPHMFFDVKLIIGSIFCFCLSYVFRYGALLQWLQDETL